MFQPMVLLFMAAVLSRSSGCSIMNALRNQFGESFNRYGELAQSFPLIDESVGFYECSVSTLNIEPHNLNAIAPLLRKKLGFPIHLIRAGHGCIVLDSLENLLHE
jgi:hypothetical protein